MNIAQTLEHVELVERVYASVKRMIFDQELMPGDKLVQERLARTLGVSRSPLLKALQRLESELLVESIPRRGMYVKGLSPAEVIDIFECRAAIEGLSAGLAAEHCTDEEAQGLRAIFEPYFRRRRIGKEAYARSDREFHDRVMVLSRNSVVRRMEMLNSIQLRAYQAGLLRPPAETLNEHMGIILSLIHI